MCPHATRGASLTQRWTNPKTHHPKGLTPALLSSTRVGRVLTCGFSRIELCETGRMPEPDSGGPNPDGPLAGATAHDGDHDLLGLHDRLMRVERALGPTGESFRHFEEHMTPVWQRVTRGEPRLSATLSIVAIIAMQIALPEKATLGPRWAVPTIEGVLLIGLVAANPGRIERQSPVLRSCSIALIAIVSAANAWSAGHLVRGVVRGTLGKDPAHLLMNGAGIWLTNVIVFGLWYWELDRGGPAARSSAARPYPDFLFPQMQDRALASPGWAPTYLDYFYLSFTNATAFSPTDVLPLAHWAKLTMAIQSAVSLVTVALVIARAINILPT